MLEDAANKQLRIEREQNREASKRNEIQEFNQFYNEDFLQQYVARNQQEHQEQFMQKMVQSEVMAKRAACLGNIVVVQNLPFEHFAKIDQENALKITQERNAL